MGFPRRESIGVVVARWFQNGVGDPFLEPMLISGTNSNILSGNGLRFVDHLEQMPIDESEWANGGHDLFVELCRAANCFANSLYSSLAIPASSVARMAGKSPATIAGTRRGT